MYTPSTYSDKILSCVDCNQEFVFAATDQQFYAEKEFSEPRRCASCRAARKAARGESSGSGYGGGSSYGGGGGSSYGGGQREMFTATCDGCGGDRGGWEFGLRLASSGPGNCSAQRLILSQPYDGGGKRLGIAGGNEQAGYLVGHHLTATRDISGDDGAFRCHGLEQGLGQTFPI